jgi:hypothetical protein
MHLSKVKHSKFNESGQLLLFYFVSAAWGADLIVRVSIFQKLDWIELILCMINLVSI